MFQSSSKYNKTPSPPDDEQVKSDLNCCTKSDLEKFQKLSGSITSVDQSFPINTNTSSFIQDYVELSNTVKEFECNIKGIQHTYTKLQELSQGLKTMTDTLQNNTLRTIN